MANIDVLSFFGGMAEQYNRNVAAEQERDAKVQEQIRAAQLKYKAKMIEQHNKRMNIVKQVRAHQKAGNYDLATAGIMKADADYTDWKALSEQKNIFTGERNKEAVEYWLKQAEDSRAPSWDDDNDTISKYSAGRQNLAEDIYEKMMGVPKGSAIVSATHGDSEPVPAAFQFEEKKDDDWKTSLQTVTDETGAQVLAKVDYRTGPGQPAHTTILMDKSPTKPARSLDKQERSAINTYFDSTLKHFKREDPQIYDFLAQGISDGTQTGPLHSEFSDRIATYRMIPGTQAGDAAQQALRDILDMKKAGFIEHSKGSWLTDPTFRILSPEEMRIKLQDRLRNNEISREQAAELYNRFINQ